MAALARPWRWSRKLQAALLAEFIGMSIFQIYGGNAPDSGESHAWKLPGGKWSVDCHSQTR